MGTTEWLLIITLKMLLFYTFKNIIVVIRHIRQYYTYTLARGKQKKTFKNREKEREQEILIQIFEIYE